MHVCEYSAYQGYICIFLFNKQTVTLLRGEPGRHGDNLSESASQRSRRRRCPHQPNPSSALTPSYSGFPPFSSTTRTEHPVLRTKKERENTNSTAAAMAVEGKSKVLVIGGTGYIGRFMVEASAKAGNPTFLLLRKSSAESANSHRAKLLQGFKDAGVTFLYGDLYDHKSLVSAVKLVDVVISTIGTESVEEQTRIIDAIKEAGNVKRFFPSEFGNDVDRVHAVEPVKSAYEEKAKIRRLLEAEGIPHTIVSSNFFAGYFLPSLAQPGFLSSPPRDKVIVLGDGNPKAVFVSEEDVGTYTIRAAEDPRTLNKIVYLRPPANILSFNELVALWERKIGKTLEKIYVHEEAGDHTNFEIEPSFGVEASELYPDVKYTTVSEILDQFV
ncbi:hypothetical protein Taro_021303 [Colocasia esculenta]|uniref:NmrA-like domain-containing protein n=1 Tax=Colocasia esculenta TaxID=4460 RepID=A0A843V4Y8_COLES|nr:hypothetical protein [Colocasia esculenta]